MRADVLRLGLLALITAGGGILVWLLLSGDLTTVRTWVHDAGPWAPAAYLLAHIVLTTLPVPKNIVAVMGGALFGLVGGSLLSWAASMVSGALAFGLGRWLGHDAVEHLAGPRLLRVDAALGEHGFGSVLAARLTPVAPFAVVGYAAGSSRVRWRDFVTGTAVGAVPGTVAYVAIGATGTQGPVPLVLGVVGALVLLAGGVWLGRSLHARASGSDQP